MLFFACANGKKPKVEKPTAESYIGVNVPDFKSSEIDSLVRLYEADRALFYKAKAKNDMPSYYKQKIGSKDNYNVTGFYDQVIRILNKEADKDELTKFQDYVTESSAKSKEFMAKIKQ